MVLYVNLCVQVILIGDTTMVCVINAMSIQSQICVLDCVWPMIISVSNIAMALSSKQGKYHSARSEQWKISPIIISVS